MSKHNIAKLILISTILSLCGCSFFNSQTTSGTSHTPENIISVSISGSSCERFSEYKFILFEYNGDILLNAEFYDDNYEKSVIENKKIAKEKFDELIEIIKNNDIISQITDTSVSDKLVQDGPMMKISIKFKDETELSTDKKVKNGFLIENFFKNMEY